MVCSLTTIESLSLPYCKLTAVDPAVSKLLSNLKQLDLSHNHFSQVRMHR